MESFVVNDKVLKLTQDDLDKILQDSKELNIKLDAAKLRAATVDKTNRRALLNARKELQARVRDIARWQARMRPTLEFLKIVIASENAEAGTVTHAEVEEKSDRGS